VAAAPAGRRSSTSQRDQQQGTSRVASSPVATTAPVPAGAPPPLKLLGLIAGQATYATMLRSNHLATPPLIPHRHYTNDEEKLSYGRADCSSTPGEAGSDTATAGAVMVIDPDQHHSLLQQSVMGVNPVFYIGALAVDPLLRGCGLGAELLVAFSDHFLYHHAVNYAAVCLHTRDLTAGPGGASSDKRAEKTEGATAATAGAESSPSSSAISSSSSTTKTATATAVQHGYDGGIWLHCLHSDKPLLRFYEKRGYRMTKVLVDYYEMPNKTKADAALLCCIPDHTSPAVYSGQQPKAPCRTPAALSNPAGAAGGGGTRGGEEATGRHALSSCQTLPGRGGSALMILNAKQRIQHQAVSLSTLVKCDTLWVGYPSFSSSNGNPTSNHHAASSTGTWKQNNMTNDEDRCALLQQVIDRVIDVELISFREAQEFMMQQCYAVSSSDRFSRRGGGRRSGTWLWWLWRPCSDETAQERSGEEAEEDGGSDDDYPCATASLVCFACVIHPCRGAPIDMI